MGPSPPPAGRRLASQLLLAALLLLAAAAGPVQPLDNGLARTPPMGWLAWERFTCQTDCERFPDHCISERLFLEMAKRLHHDGWLDAGYQYLNIDDCWSEMQRDAATGRLVADRARFPSGIARLASQVHELGLRLGLYGDCGAKTCAGYPAQLNAEPAKLERDNHFQLDADTFADWRIDSFKFDGCHVDPLRAESICPAMASALNRTARPVLLICEWPFYMMYAHAEPDFELAGRSCNVWRYYDDIEGPGHWFDPDQLVIGNFGLSLDQQRAQMALWSVWAAPLYMSNDLRAIGEEAERILKNRHLIRANQDPLGVFGLMTQQSADGLHQAFVKPVLPVHDGCPSFVVVYLNRATLGNKRRISFRIRDLLLGAPIGQAARNQLSARQQASTLYSGASARGAGDKSASSADYAAPDVADKPPSSPGAAGGEPERRADDEAEAAAAVAAAAAAGRQLPAEQEQQIQVSKCFRRIREAVARPADGANERAEKRGPPRAPFDWLLQDRPGEPRAAELMELDVFDLFENGRQINGEILAPADRLELEVGPSSVRAVRLAERRPPRPPPPPPGGSCPDSVGRDD